MNTQAPEKIISSDASSLEIHSIFFTIQGEGPFCGERAIFIRLAGCNLQCPGCDTDYTSTRTNMANTTIVAECIRITHKNIYNFNDRGKRPLIVITGGEPFRQNFGGLLNELFDQGFRKVQIETNGTHFPKWASTVSWSNLKNPKLDGHYIVCSPKTGRVSPNMTPYIVSYKYVVSALSEIDKTDGLPVHVLEHPCRKVARPTAFTSTRVYIQPQDDKDPVKNAKNLEAAVKLCQQYGHTLQLQIHKLIGVE